MERNLEHWTQNILPIDSDGFSVQEYMHKLVQPEDFNLRDKLERWREVGIVTFEKVVDDDDINSLQHDIRFLNDHRSIDLEVEWKGARYRLKDLPIPNRPTLIILGYVCKLSCHHLAASWIALENVHPDAGPLEYYPGTHPPGVLVPYDWGNGSLIQKSGSVGTPADFVSYLAGQIDRMNMRPEVFLPKRGDLLIWHGGLLHGGTKVKDRSRTRQSYVTHYTSLGAYPSGHSFPDAFESQRFTSLNDGYVFDYPWVREERCLPSWRSK